MKRHYIIPMLVAGLITVLSGCRKKDDLDISNLFPENTQQPTALDTWLTEHYTKPYNIEVRYKWDPYVATDKTLIPVREPLVIPVMDLVHKTWAEPYIKIAGMPFFLKYAPKQFILIGSAKWNSNGTITVGEAEGGKAIQLFRLNEFDLKNEGYIKFMLHTIHHEFAHILHQTIFYPREFKALTASGYTGTWNNTTDQEALDLGFITPYARSKADEDFVEMLSTMLTEGKEGFEAIVNQAETDYGKDMLHQKAEIVRNYLQNSWKINLDSLQLATSTAIKEAIK
ncbi:zinc-binding metallopeptidase [Chitinophaga qingshengii]|uniref:Zinc-binding metallopeptidase n=1 Tax=Chitinophaga qingshengii TaxID=1569794 RepID=A0ABR7TZF8_9BACT|nr:putative zinc-binding metallopeptidase [Chitinophaga qingshengii]MBC9934749.1 putative zinc-binding metallopeptidase [Chitinophaga qingshengii]